MFTAIRAIGPYTSWKQAFGEALSRSEEQLRAFAARLQQAREEEALRIARELHDQLGRCLTAIKMDVAGIERGLTDGAAEGGFQTLSERTKRMSQTLDETVHTVRRILAELRPAVLDDLGLSAAVESQARDFEARSGVSCVFRVDESSQCFPFAIIWLIQDQESYVSQI